MRKLSRREREAIRREADSHEEYLKLVKQLVKIHAAERRALLNAAKKENPEEEPWLEWMIVMQAVIRYYERAATEIAGTLETVARETYLDALDSADEPHQDSVVVEYNQPETALNTSKENIRRRMSEIVLNGLQNNQTRRSIVRSLRKQFDIALNSSKRIARTQGNLFFNRASLRAFLKMGYTQYQLLAVLDERTSKICRKLDGNVYDITDAVVGETLPPFHDHCRTVIIPAGKRIDFMNENA